MSTVLELFFSRLIIGRPFSLSTLTLSFTLFILSQIGWLVAGGYTCVEEKEAGLNRIHCYLSSAEDILNLQKKCQKCGCATSAETDICIRCFEQILAGLNLNRICRRPSYLYALPPTSKPRTGLFHPFTNTACCILILRCVGSIIIYIKLEV